MRGAHTFDAHTEGITTVQWCPDQRGVFASAAEDGYLNVWDVGRGGKAGRRGGTGGGVWGARTPAPGRAATSARAGGRETPAAARAARVSTRGAQSRVSDFQWNPFDPWTIAGVSSGDGGNTLQMWRVNDLIYRPEEEALAELGETQGGHLRRSETTKKGAPEEGGDAGEDTEGGGEGDAMRGVSRSKKNVSSGARVGAASHDSPAIASCLFFRPRAAFAESRFDLGAAPRG